jgi:hypothetical protein
MDIKIVNISLKMADVPDVIGMGKHQHTLKNY